MHLRTLLSVALLSLGLGCGDSTTGSSSADATGGGTTEGPSSTDNGATGSSCTPGQMTACTCSDGGAGVAACNEAGDGTEACECVGNGTGGGDTADTYVEGLEKTGSQGHFTVRLLNSNPIPKDLTYYTWTLEVLDPDGKAVEGVEVIAEPTMPNHGHGTFPPFTTATAGETPGTYVLTDMDLFMAGIWHIAIRLTLDGTADEVAYSFDLDG